MTRSDAHHGVLPATVQLRTTGAASRSTGWTAYAVAVLNVFAVPSIYRGNDFLGAMARGGMPSPGVLLSPGATSVVGLAYLGWLSAVFGVAEPSTGRQSPPVPTKEASADPR